MGAQEMENKTSYFGCVLMKIIAMRKLILLFILALVGLAFVFSQNTTTIPKDQNIAIDISKQPDPTQPNQEVYTFKVEGFNKEKKVEWGLEGDSATIVDEKVNIKNLKAVYYKGDTTFNLFSEKAIYKKEAQEVELMENVVGKSSDGGELITDYAKWNSGLEEITTDSIVTIMRDNLTCIGKGLITKPKLNWASFKEDIEVDFGEDKRITCDGPFEIDHDSNIAIFNKNVKVYDKESVMHTDKLTVYMEPETNKVLSVVTEGNVKIVHKGDLEDMSNFGKVSF
jgi:LPS export ABC transporter protein LptC